MGKFILHQKTYDFILWLYPIINRLPKNHRLILGRNLEDLALSLLMVLMKANKARGMERKNLQVEASETLDYLRVMLRLSKDLHLSSVKQYLACVAMLNEIGRMLTSWTEITKRV